MRLKIVWCVTSLTVAAKLHRELAGHSLVLGENAACDDAGPQPALTEKSAVD